MTPGLIVRVKGCGAARYRLVRRCGGDGDWYLSRDLTGTAGEDWDLIAHEATFILGD